MFNAKVLKIAHKLYMQEAIKNNTRFFVKELSPLIISRESASFFQLGLCSKHSLLSAHLNAIDCAQTKMSFIDSAKEVGLIKGADRGIYDVFANRLIIPLFNVQGEILGFSGRAMANSLQKILHINTRNMGLQI